MAQIKRVQVLMEPSEFQQLELVAAGLGRSAGDLIREAVRERWLVTDEQRLGAAAALNRLDLPTLDIEHLDGVVTIARTEGLR